MRSLRQRLLVGLTLGMAGILLAGGTAIYLLVRAGLRRNLDDELRLAAIAARQVLAGEKRASKQGGVPKHLRRWALFEEEDSGLYYQMWNGQGAVVERSPSLGGHTLPPPPPDPLPDKGFDLADPGTGQRFRAMVFFLAGQRRPARTGAAGERESTDGEKRRTAMVARDCEDVDRTLSFLAGGITGVALVMGLGSAFVITRGLGRGLRPLQDMGRQAATIDAHSLSARFDIAGLPKELRPIGDRLNDLMARLEASFERERRFGADLAHEMRTPLAELRAMAESALRWPDQVAAEDFANILASTHRMQDIIEKLLALARAEHAAALAHSEPVHLARMLAASLEPFEARFADRRLALDLAVPDDLVWPADPGLLRLILDNLFSNAVDYAPPDGRISVRADAGSLAVANTAGSVTADDASRFFDRCWRGDQSRTDARHAGLGLSLAKVCAEAMDFDLTARVEHGDVVLELKRPAALHSAK